MNTWVEERGRFKKGKHNLCNISQQVQVLIMSSEWERVIKCGYFPKGKTFWKVSTALDHEDSFGIERYFGEIKTFFFFKLQYLLSKKKKIPPGSLEHLGTIWRVRTFMETQEHLDTFGNQTLLIDNVRKVGTSLEVVGYLGTRGQFVKSQDI